jgi:hypothetical protein
MYDIANTDASNQVNLRAIKSVIGCVMQCKYTDRSLLRSNWPMSS